MPKKDKNQETEKQAMTSNDIRAMREDELLDSVYREKTKKEKNVEVGVIWFATVVSTAVIIVALHYFGILNSLIGSVVLPYLWMIENGSGFLAEFFSKIIELALVLFITVSFSFALNINYSSKGRDKGSWTNIVKYSVWAAFGIDLIYLVMSRLFGNPFAMPDGGIFSQVMYFITKLLVVPFANVMLYLVLPSAVIRMILTLISDTREKTEIPLTVASSVTMILGMLGMSWSGLRTAGFLIVLYAIVQGVAYSIVYHRTDTIWRPVLLYSGVTAVYYVLAFLLSLI